jgi:hypothetical protein
MDDSQFWAIIEAGGPYGVDDQQRQLASVRRQLRNLPATEVMDCYRLFCQKMIDSQTWDLWGAAYLIHHGCSDDGFVYFRAWLISQGRAIYTAAVENPDSLAAVTSVDRDYHFELLYALPRQVYEELTGQDMPRLRLNWPANPSGKKWDFDDREEFAKRLPRLTQKHRV